MVFPHSHLGLDVSGALLAEIGEAVDVVVSFVIAVSAHESPCDGALCTEYSIEAVDFGCEFYVQGRCDGTHRSGGCEFAVRSDDASVPG